MTDVFTKEKRSELMSKIRGRNTKPEIHLKNALKGLRLRYQPKMYGRPDFASSTKKITIFVDGCFWHKCPKCYKTPQSNTEYWIPKIERNVCRDKEVNRNLKKMGWIVCRVWEHEIKDDPEKTLDKVLKMLDLRTI